VYLGKGGFEGALALFDQALAVAQAVAPRNPQTVRALHNIAAVHRARGEDGLAETYSKRAGDIEGGLGPSN
jgi:hypothetical protein